MSAVLMGTLEFDTDAPMFSPVTTTSGAVVEGATVELASAKAVTLVGAGAFLQDTDDVVQCKDDGSITEVTWRGKYVFFDPTM